MTRLIGHLIGAFVYLSARFNTLLLKSGRCICGKVIYVKKGEKFPSCPKHGDVRFTYENLN